MFIEFKNFPEEEIELLLDDNQDDLDLKFERQNTLRKENFYKRRANQSFHDALFSCECLDFIHNHKLGEGKCNSCECKKLTFTEVCLELVFTVADIFEVDNPNHSDPDSPQWWAEFTEWYKNNVRQ